jgi:hypothetical protein
MEPGENVREAAGTGPTRKRWSSGLQSDVVYTIPRGDIDGVALCNRCVSSSDWFGRRLGKGKVSGEALVLGDQRHVMSSTHWFE